MTSADATTIVDRRTVDDIIEWDVRNWSKALPFWSAHLDRTDGAEALTLGERHGGSSLWCALQGMRVVATDLHGVTDRGRECHVRYGLTERIRYAHVDATELPFADASFDVVLFKSVLGALRTKERQARAVGEMHRVLRPGATLLFAENLTGSAAHRLARRFVPWSHNWRYLRCGDDLDLFESFDGLQVAYHGVLGAFGRSAKQRDLLGSVDTVISPVTPDRMKYIVFGAATKR